MQIGLQETYLAKSFYSCLPFSREFCRVLLNASSDWFTGGTARTDFPLSSTWRIIFTTPDSLIFGHYLSLWFSDYAVDEVKCETLSFVKSRT